MRPRITKPQLVRSTNHTTNSKIVRKSKQHMRRVEKNRTFGRFLYNAFGVKDRFIYNEFGV